MENSIHKYFQAGIIQWISYPQGDPMEPLKAICKDDSFDVIELEDYGYKNEEAERFLEQSHLKVYYGVQPRLPGGKLNPSDFGEEGRKKAEATLIEAVDEAEYLGVKGTAFLAGKWQPETRRQAYMQLLKTTRAVCDYPVEKGMMVGLGVFDYDMDKAALIGPASYTAEFAADMRTTHSNFGLLVDLNHFPTTYETSRLVIRTLRPYITHFHFGNAVVAKGCDGYGDPHSRFGYPNNADDTPQLLDYLKVIKGEGFFDVENPYVLSMEVTLRPGENENITLVSTKRVLKWAWALLENNA